MRQKGESTRAAAQKRKKALSVRCLKAASVFSDKINFTKKNFKRRIVGLHIGPPRIAGYSHKNRVRTTGVKSLKTFTPIGALDHPGKRWAVSNPAHAIVIPDDVAARAILPSEFKTAFDLRIGKNCEWHAKDQNDCPSPMAIKKAARIRRIQVFTQYRQTESNYSCHQLGRVGSQAVTEKVVGKGY
jgi:hypothetical protein